MLLETARYDLSHITREWLMYEAGSPILVVPDFVPSLMVSISLARANSGSLGKVLDVGGTTGCIVPDYCYEKSEMYQ